MTSMGFLLILVCFFQKECLMTNLQKDSLDKEIEEKIPLELTGFFEIGFVGFNNKLD
jgi:hypothetical protein